MRRFLQYFTPVALLCFALAANAGAASTIGETTGSMPGSDEQTVLQTVSPGNSFAAPADGVITSWSYQNDSFPSNLGPIQLKIGRLAAGEDDYRIIGESALENPTALGARLTFPAQIAVKAGDVLGLYSPEDGGLTAVSSDPGFAFHHDFTTNNHPVGETFPYVGPTQGVINAAAVLEPDADNDGFGDETQDACPTGAGAAECVPPETTFTKVPKAKTKKRKVKFAFTSSEAGSTFECKLDRKPFKPCTSPLKRRVKKGKHTFTVRAIDPAGNVDPTGAVDKFKVKRKPKK